MPDDPIEALTVYTSGGQTFEQERREYRLWRVAMHAVLRSPRFAAMSTWAVWAFAVRYDARAKDPAYPFTARARN